jgi:hypothetical protein
MKQTIITILILFLLSCNGIKQINQVHDKDSFQINRIESKNDWYFIYAIRLDSTFMIVSKKVDIEKPEWEKIKTGNYYKFRLSSIIPVINGVKMIPINYLDFAGIKLDEQTLVNINPEKGIYDIYSSDNLKGLYFIK